MISLIFSLSLLFSSASIIHLLQFIFTVHLIFQLFINKILAADSIDPSCGIVEIECFYLDIFLKFLLFSSFDSFVGPKPKSFVSFPI